MIRAVLERLLFGILLLVFLQVPILSDHYVQYLSGYLSASQKQINQLNTLANSNGFTSTQQLIDSLLANADGIVRQDAENKQVLVREHAQLTTDIERLQTGNYAQRLLFLLTPSQYTQLGQVLHNFKPGIPLTLSDLLASIGFALLFSLLLWLPFARRNRRDKYTSSWTAS